ncbi:hypothetical protein ACQ7HM_19245 [Williamsia sp. MIQD14]|uniref:hypothetical protein n=1 Tax=Williamsia sp. MIQD14 TaxID=3425703 RepID=UPI003DA0BC54
MPAYRPTSPDALVDLCVEAVTRRPGVVVAGIDGADAAHPTDLAARVAQVLRTTGRAAAVVAVGDYVRPASVRKEYGHTDTESYRTMWFDWAALDREVVTALRAERRWLPRLWDPVTDRSPRDRPRPAAPDQVVLLAGPMLLGRGLDLAPTVRLEMSAAALRRRTPESDHWTVDAVLEHAAQVGDIADLTVRYDHPDRPAVIDGRTG